MCRFWPYHSCRGPLSSPILRFQNCRICVNPVPLNRMPMWSCSFTAKNIISVILTAKAWLILLFPNTAMVRPDRSSCSLMPKKSPLKILPRAWRRCRHDPGLALDFTPALTIYIYLLKSMSMFNKLKQIKDLRSQAKELQKTLSQETVHESAAGGKVNLDMDGNQKILSVDVDAELLSPDKKETIERGIKDAVNGAIKKLQTQMAKKMQKGEIEMPDLSSLKK